MKHSSFVFFQVSLVLQYPWNAPAADPLQLWTLPDATRADSWTKPPFLDDIAKFGRQLQSCTSTHPAISVGSAGYNLQLDSVFLGHDIAFTMKHSPFVFFQIFFKTFDAASSQDEAQENSDTFNVEVCIVATKNYRDDYSDYVEMAAYFGAMINSVNLIYEEMVNPKVQFQLNGVTVWNSSKVITYVNHLVDGPNTRSTMMELVKTGCFRICDVVTLITKDKIAVEQGRKKGTASGLAGTSFVCTDMKIAIVHDKPHSYAAVITLAHELAHLIGATHDGQGPIKRHYEVPGAKKCPSSQGYLMGNGDLLGVRKYKLSKCSMDQIRARYRTLPPGCITVTAEPYERTKDFPGRNMTTSNLCTALLGQGAAPAPESDYARCYIRCCNFQREDAGPWCVEQKLLDGMECSEGKVRAYRTQAVTS